MNAAEYITSVEDGIFTVSSLDNLIKSIVGSIPSLQSVYVRGELSGVKHQSSGYLYFTLKDEKSQISCTMFNTSVLQFRPDNGMKVVLNGRVDMYSPKGSIQIIVNEIIPEGIGAIALAYEQLKKRLETEGLFDITRKKPLPHFPGRIGIVTSSDGAVLHDIIKVTRKRCPLTELYLYPASVQGTGAAAQIAKGIEFFNARAGSVDVIIVGRGGGSMEDLWEFNNEQLVRTVAASEIPVISAVGHETDTTLCDLAADVRAATPSQAAEFAVPDIYEMLRKINGYPERMASAVSGIVSARRQMLDRLQSSPALNDPMWFTADRRQTVDMFSERLGNAVSNILLRKQNELESAAGKLHALSPLNILSRGYSAVFREDGSLVHRIDEVEPGDSVKFRTIGGEAECTVNEVRKTDE